MDLHVVVIEAADIPKMDSVGKTDAYVILGLMDQEKKAQRKTKVVSSDKPQWNEEFSFPIVRMVVISFICRCGTRIWLRTTKWVDWISNWRSFHRARLLTVGIL
jgi:hypothetical protein